jgi:hypothetical protein
VVSIKGMHNFLTTSNLMKRKKERKRKRKRPIYVPHIGMDRITLRLVRWQILWAFQESNQFLSFVCPKKGHCNIQVYAILYYIMLLALFPTIFPSCIKMIHVHEEFCKGVVCCWLHHHHIWRRTDILMLCEASMSKKVNEFSFLYDSSTRLPRLL